MAGIILNDNLETRAPKSLDSRYSNLDGSPFSSISGANSAITSSYRYSGLTVNILGEEYWYKNGIADIDLVVKSSFDNSLFNTYTGATETRLQVIEGDITGLTSTLSGFSATTNVTLTGITADVTYISGITDTKQNQLSGGSGINPIKLAGDVVEIVLSGFTAFNNINIAITGTTSDFIFTDGSTVKRGIEYGGNYAPTYSLRSLVDKQYVDSLVSGLSAKNAVQLATTEGDGNINLVGPTGGIIDGVAMLDGWRILIKNQTDSIENGIYTYNITADTLSRSTDFDESVEITSGAFTSVITGNTLLNTVWIITTPNPITVDVTDIDWSVFALPSAGILDIIDAGNGDSLISGISSNVAIFRTLSGGTNITLSIVDDTLVLSAIAGAFQGFTGVTNLSGGTGIYAQSVDEDIELKSLVGGENVEISATSNTIIISVTGASSVIALTVITANTILDNTYDVVIVDSSSSGLTITLPSTPDANQIFMIKDNGNALTNIISIIGNGRNIDDAATAVINTDYGAIKMVYSLSQDNWFVLSFNS